MLNTQVPTRAELVRRAAELIPVLQANAPWADEHQRLHDESVEAMADAGIFKMRVPVRYGGYECDTRTLVEVGAQIGRGDGAAAFCASVWWIPTWISGLFPDEFQDEIFATPDVRVCGTLGPSGTFVRSPGGITVTGRWPFNSGVPHSHWKMLAAVPATPADGDDGIMAILPIADIEILDDWYTSGLKGTGSATVVVQDLFIADGRFLPLTPLLNRQSASKLNADVPIFRAPMIAAASASSIGTPLGLAQGARDVFLGRLPDRHITYTDYPSQGAAPLTHLQVAEATLKIDRAEFRAMRLADTVDRKAENDESWSIDERVGARMDMGRVCQLAQEAVSLLSTASGGSSIYSNMPMQRIRRDTQTIFLHGLNHPDTNLELYGRVLCGLAPNSDIL